MTEAFLILLAAPPKDNRPACVRLRAFLKAARRMWELKCVQVRGWQAEFFEGGAVGFFATHGTVQKNGLFSVLEGGLEWVAAPSFPAICPNLTLLAKFSFEPSECGKAYECVAKVTGPDGGVLEPRLSVTMRPVINVSQGASPGTFTVCYNFDRIRFQQSGAHRFLFFVGELQLGEMSLEARLELPQ